MKTIRYAAAIGIGLCFGACAFVLTSSLMAAEYTVEGGFLAAVWALNR